MSSAASGDSLGQQILNVRTRPDLVMRPLWFGGTRYWGVKDPAAMRYFQIRDEEHFVLEQLRQGTTAALICDRFERRFAPRRLEVRHLHAFLGLLYRQGLLVSDAIGQGEQLLMRRRDRLRTAAASALANPLAIRLPGFDPHRSLHWLSYRLRPLFSTVSLIITLALVVSATLLVAIHFDVLSSRLPSVGDFVSPHNLFWLAVIVGLTKVLHEIAHGVACCHFGGECHEMGVMFLIFTPCLYCNVTDAWLFPSKWQRAAVGMAGIAVEMVLASLAAWGWWFTQPGVVNSILLNAMIVCSVSTVLLNGNPLLRFDGYFVLCDLLEVPNLQPRAMAVAAAAAKKWLLGLDLEHDPIRHEPHQGPLLLYALLSAAYRLLVVLGVLWILHRALRGHDLETFSFLLATFVLIGMVWPMAAGAVRSLRDPGLRRQIRPHRVWPGLLWTFSLVAAVCFVPLPSRLLVPAMLEPLGSEPVYVSVAGTLRAAVTAGQHVRTGDVLARLENPDLHREVAELTGQLELQRIRLANLRSVLAVDRAAEQQIPAVEESLRDLEQRRDQRLLDQQRLILRSPRDGTVLPPPYRESPPPSDVLPQWSGSPLEPRNIGALMETGTLLCQVGDARRLHALLVLDQSDVEFVERGQTVRILTEEFPGRSLQGRVTEVSELRLDRAPREFLVSGLLPVRNDRQWGDRPTRTCYLARVTLEPRSIRPLLSASGRASVAVHPRCLAARLWRFAHSQIRFGS